MNSEQVIQALLSTGKITQEDIVHASRAGELVESIVHAVWCDKDHDTECSWEQEEQIAGLEPTAHVEWSRNTTALLRALNVSREEFLAAYFEATHLRTEKSEAVLTILRLLLGSPSEFWYFIREEVSSAPPDPSSSQSDEPSPTHPPSP